MPPKKDKFEAFEDVDGDQDSGQQSKAVKMFLELQKHHTQNLNAEYWRFITRTGRSPMALKDSSSVWDVYLKWHEYNLEKHDKEDFSGIDSSNVPNFGEKWLGQNKPRPQQSIMASEMDVFKNFLEYDKSEQLFQSKTSHQVKFNPWNMRLSNKIINKLRGLSTDRQQQTLMSIFSLQLGLMADAQILDTGPIMYLAGFSKRIKNNQTIVFAIVPERVPVIQTVLNKTHICGFTYRQYLRIIDLVQTNDKGQAYSSFENFLHFIREDPDKWNPFEQGNFLEGDNKAQFNSMYELLDIRNIVNIDQNPIIDGTVYKVMLDQSHKMSTAEFKSFSQVGGRWVSNLEESKLSFQIRPAYELKNVNKMIIEKCTSEESCKWLLDFLHRIPNFNLNLTAQECRLISTPGNVLCIGRSGTGKTTSAVLRLFAIEILFKIRSTLFFKGATSLKSNSFTSEEAESTNTGLHSVIVTASPVLTNEIRRFYQGLKNKVVTELRARETRRKEREAAAQRGGKEGVEEVKVEVPEKWEDVDKKVLDEEEMQMIEEQVAGEKVEDIGEDINEDELMDMEEIEKNMKMPQSMQQMRNDDFPAFLTIKRLVYMIDGSLRRPFFARNLKNEVIGLDSQAEWHNEQKGVMMINNYFKGGAAEPKAKQDDDIDKFMNLSSSDEGESDSDYESSEDEGSVFKEASNQMEKSKRKKTKFIQGERVVQEYAQEVDFDLFERKFWPKHGLSSRSLNTAAVWTEIFSTIKGSHNSCDYVKQGLPMEVYINQTFRRSILEEPEKVQIYNTYLRYEQWKQQIKGFDFMDIVNHILRELKGAQYRGTPIHFMLVDEVQDLTAATIKLLLNITEQNVYFAGDTAQTIARGVGFRFCDLKQMLNMTDFSAPKVLQLTVNFRSHNRILTLANSVISAIELFFPLTIDKLIKEKSTLDGLKPIILDSKLLDSLFYVLLGKPQDAPQQLGKGPAEFGCDQVIIVRDQDSKKSVPPVLQHALCLTVYECKGLEFEDVILYNFFNDAPDNIREQWKLINMLQIEKGAEKVKKFDPLAAEEMQSLDDLNFENQKEPEETTNVEKDGTTGIYEFADRIFLQKSNFRQTNNFQKEYSALCTELKQLYVCITRPKKRLIIYDEDSSARDILLKYWQKLDAVDVITEDIIKHSQSDLSGSQDMTEDQRQLIEKLRLGTRHQDSEAEDVKEDDSAALSRCKGWRSQGIKMFKRRYYEQAMKCFTHSGDEALKLRAQAYSLAEEASKRQSEAESLQYKLEDTGKDMDKQTKKQVRQEILGLKQEAVGLFSQASEVFLSIGLKKQAAQCLFTSEQYQKAARIFEEIGYYSQAGEALFILGEYSRAALLYSQDGKLVSKAVDCYKRLRNWDAILTCVKTHEEHFTQQQRENLIKKYVPLALNSLYSLMTQDDMIEDMEDPLDSEYPPMPAKKQKDYEITTAKDQTLDSQIPEKQASEEEDEGEVRDSQVTGGLIPDKTCSRIEEEESQVSMIESRQGGDAAEEEEKSASHQGFEMVEKPQQKKVMTDSSFSVISSNQAKEEAPVADSFEHLSQFDPEDEFIKSRSVSVLESVISGAYKEKFNRSELSDYSIIESAGDFTAFKNDAMLAIIKGSLNTIVTKRDIYAEDVLMTKIIHYVSQFSTDVKSYLGKLRSKDALLSEQINTAANQEEVFDIDLDMIDGDFLNILLDCLESFELYKLCLIVCNRYSLIDRVGRYLVSIASKYSNLSQISTHFLTMFHPQHKEVQHQVSFIAHQALHSALELIEPKYLRINEGELDSANSLGQYCFTGLLNHGYWKKVLYLMDLKSALTVSSMFCDFRNFRQIYLAFSKSGSESAKGMETQEALVNAIKNDDFSFLGSLTSDVNHPTNEIERVAFTTALDSIIWSSKDEPGYFARIQFPKCFELAGIALRLTSKFGGIKIEEKQTLLGKLIKSLDERVLQLSANQSLATEGSNLYQEQCYLYDTSAALFLLISSAFKGSLSSQIHVLMNLTPDLFQLYLRTLNGFMTYLFKSESKDARFTANLQILMQGMLSVLKVRSQLGCPALYDNYGGKVLVHSSSYLSQSLTKQIEDHKKKLADQVTKEVLAEHDSRWHTRADINRVIKLRLKALYQKESINQIVEIIDLEAQFMRAPIGTVIERIKKQVSQYVKYCTEKSMSQQQEIATLKSKWQVDDLESPFDVTERYLQIISLLNSTIEIQRFVQQRNPSFKAISSFLGKHQIHSQDSLKYHILLEEKNKLEEQIKYKQYMVDVGLIPKKELESFIAAKRKKKEDLDAVNLSQALYTKNLVMFSVLNFDPIPSQFVDQKTPQNILDAAYHYWEFFKNTKSKTDDEEHGVFKFALVSLSLYISVDKYLYFMQTIQKQLPQKSVERKCLFNLLDAHIYKKSGNYLEAAGSLIQFVQDGLKYQLNLNSFYYMNFLDMAIVLLITSKQGAMQLPYEYVKYLQQHLWTLQDEAKQDFRTQVSAYFECEEEDFPAINLSLPLSRPISNLENDADRKRYANLMASAITCLEKLISTTTSTSLVHAYLMAMTFIVNEPEQCQVLNKQLSTIFGHLMREDLLDPDCLISTYDGHYSAFAQDFHNMSYYEQNEVLLLDKRATQQSLWVTVNLVPLEGVSGKAQVEEELKRAEAKEAEMIQKLDKVSARFREVYGRVKHRKMKFSRSKVVSVEERLLVAAVTAENRSALEIAQKNLDLLRKIQTLSNFIRVVTLNSRFETVIDLHYLLTHVHKLHTVLLPLALLPQQDVSALLSDLPLEAQLQHLQDQVQLWSESKQQSHTDRAAAFNRNQRILKLKWKEQAIKVRQKVLAKVQAQKREQAVEKKRVRMKMLGL